MRALQHGLLGARVVLPAAPRLKVHGTEFPLLEWIMDPAQEPHVLLLIADREPVLDEADAGAHQHAFELRYRAVELLVLLGRAEPHDVLDAGAVVPAAVEADDFPGRRQV